MPMPPHPPHERVYYREKAPHEELMELIERRFDEIKSDLEDIKRSLK